MTDVVHDVAGVLGIDTLMPASYRGVTFDCIYTRDTLAKDTVVYAYPYRDGAEVDDQGMKAMNFRLTAIFFGNRYQTQLKAFLKALKTAGPGELVHPVYGPIPRVQFLEAGVEHEVEPLNAVTVELVFIEATTEQALFADAVQDVDSSGLVATAQKYFGDAVNALKTVQDDIARVSNIVASAEYVVQSLATEVQTTIGSALDFLDYPTAFVSDMSTMLSSFSAALPFGVSTRLSDWNAVRSVGNDLAGFPGKRFTAQQTMASGAVFASTLNRASVMPQDDRDLIDQTIRLTTVGEWCDVATDILAMESAVPSLSARDIESITNDVRSLISDAIQAQRTVMATAQTQAVNSDTATPDLRTGATLVGQLQTLAYALQKQARSLILARPPLIQRVVTRPCNLHMLAFDWYGDAARADELVRLNPDLRHPNALQQGDILNAFAQ
ncbi:DNA circulation protein [Serratia marcescens]|uniref:DNA circulation protein n=1 Tax=Serratia marcescens TaxID=615 RepID=A0A5C7BXW2_SERMA|nr:MULTISPECIES: DNA circularization N-terminal domain-containing protein [Serratia]TXE27152.1 DNA circulation protein [Serratia marcescens]TXE55291.1 DNA circulation protein [Serratia marcescens]